MTLDATKRSDTKTRTILLRAETYEKLDGYKAKVIGERRTSKITFDDVINCFLEKMDKT